MAKKKKKGSKDKDKAAKPKTPKESSRRKSAKMSSEDETKYVLSLMYVSFPTQRVKNKP